MPTALNVGERNLYGSSRLGVLNLAADAKTLPQVLATTGYGVNFVRGNKYYELSNHLGNVLSTVSDKKIAVDDRTYDSTGTKLNSTPDGKIDYYTADVITANDFYPFGMLQPGRKYSAGNGYRWGFNGKENDKDVVGDGNEYDYGFRIYNPRIGRFLSVDPLAKSYPWYTSYQFAGNKPIKCIDLDGLEEIDPITVIQEPKSKGEPGLAYTTARKVYFVVTAGPGALTKGEQQGLNSDEMNSRLNSTPDEPALVNEIPNGKTAIHFPNITVDELHNLSSNDPAVKSNTLAQIEDPFYVVNVYFENSIIVKQDLTLEEIVKKIKFNPSLYGIIFNSISDKQIDKLNIPTSFKDLAKKANKEFKEALNSNEEGEQAEAYGSTLGPDNKGGLDVIIMNKGYKNKVLDMSDRINHEYGHNATNNAHNDSYHYDQRGLQSKHPGNIVPNSNNKRDIIIRSSINDIYDKIIFNPDQTHV